MKPVRYCYSLCFVQHKLLLSLTLVEQTLFLFGYVESEPYPTLPYPSLPYPTLPALPYPTLPYPTLPTLPHLTLSRAVTLHRYNFFLLV